MVLPSPPTRPQPRRQFRLLVLREIHEAFVCSVGWQLENALRMLFGKVLHENLKAAGTEPIPPVGRRPIWIQVPESLADNEPTRCNRRHPGGAWLKAWHHGSDF